MADADGDSVLLVHHRDLSSPVGTTLAYYLASELSDAHTVHVICRRRAKERSGETQQNAVLYDIDTGDIPILSPIAFHLLAAFLAVLLGIRHRYAVVYCFKSCLIQGWIGARAAGSRFVVGLQSVPVRQAEDFTDASDYDGGIRRRLALHLLGVYSKVVGGLLERSSAVVCLTDGIATVTEETYGVDLSDAHRIGMGVDVETFASGRGPSEADERSSDWTLTYIGNVSETRGLERVLEALSEIDRDLTFQIAGQGPSAYRTVLMERAEALNVSDQIEWLGLLPHEEVPRLLSTSDVCISPLPDIESYRVSFPAKLVEYMAAGTVVVATEIPPHRRLIDDGTNGFLYDGSLEGLVDTIERAIETDARDDIERRASETARAYDWETIVDQHEAAIFDSSSSTEQHVRSRTEEAAAE